MVDGEFILLLIFLFRTIKSWQQHSSPPNLKIKTNKPKKQIHETQTPNCLRRESEKDSQWV